MQFSEVITFWFEEIKTKQWWVKDLQFDALIETRFGEVYAQAINSELISWREQDEGRLAEIIVLDQFSRNMYRGQAASFAHDHLALAATKAALEAGTHTRLSVTKTNFLLMPIMHSESLEEHLLGFDSFEQYSAPGTLNFELKHRAIIERFGRYPHRNEILGRQSTAEEIEFLNQPGSSF